MGKKIAIVAAKGGVGKTTISHLFCIGAGLHRKPAYLAATDNQTQMPESNRPYKIIDARTSEGLKHFVQVSDKAPEEHSFVIDGAANRPEFDLLAARWADIVIVPHRSSDLDGDEAVSDISNFIKNGVSPRHIYTLRTQARGDEKREDFIHEKLADLGIEVNQYSKRLNQHAALKYVLNKDFKTSNIDTFTRQAAKALYAVTLRQIELIEREISNA